LPASVPAEAIDLRRTDGPVIRDNIAVRVALAQSATAFVDLVPRLNLMNQGCFSWSGGR